jgi:diguanylate cyclase (GGDEF)-like protein
VCRVPGQPFAPQSEGRWPALSLGFLFLTGAALVGLSSAVPGREELLPTIACVVAALVTGAILVAWGRPLALGALAGVLGLGAVLITVVIAASGRPAALDAVLYVWVTAYAGYFFPRRWLAATVAVIGLLYVAALTSAATADRAQHFLLVVGGAAGAGVFVALLRAQADRLVDQRLEAARTDALTGLPNRTQLAVRAGTALARARRTGTGVALLLVDLDEFKLVNDALGHAAGDELLRQAGARLHGTVRDTDTVARLGGDEFAVLLEPVDDADGAAEAAERTVAALCAGFDLGDETVQLPCSIGIALAGPGHDLERLLRDADLAMYAAKARGGGYAFFEDAMHQEVRRRRELTRDMQAAADREELVLDFQPIVDLRRETVVAVEALVRWEHPQHGLLAPDAFIPLAEQSGAIVELGRWGSPTPAGPPRPGPTGRTGPSRRPCRSTCRRASCSTRRSRRASATPCAPAGCRRTASCSRSRRPWS